MQDIFMLQLMVIDRIFGTSIKSEIGFAGIMLGKVQNFEPTTFASPVSPDRNYCFTQIKNDTIDNKDEHCALTDKDLEGHFCKTRNTRLIYRVEQLTL